MNLPSDTYCILPFIHAQVTPNGHLSPCCRYRTNLAKKNSLTLKDFDQWWQHELQPLRRDLLAGQQPSGCSNCWDDEDRGIQSYRQDNLRMFKHRGNPVEPLTYPVFWMMGIGNYCNIRCIMCSPFSSTNWMTEFERNRSQFQRIGIDFSNYPRGAWAEQDLAPLESVAQQAEMIHFSGGEPLMTTDYLRVLRSVQNPSDTVLIINSNLQEVSEEWMQILPQFRTQLNISLEGVGTHNDYIRYGSDWTSIVNNIQRLQDKGVELQVTHAFGRTSLVALIPLLEFCLHQKLSITFTPLRMPAHLSIHAAPMSEREKFLQQLTKKTDLKQIPGYFRLKEFAENLATDGYDSKLDHKFWQYIDVMDSLHGMNFREIFNVDQT